MKKAENLCRIVRNEKGCGTGYCSAPSWIKELNYNENYKMLLLNQLNYCNKNRDLILQRAESTYRKALSRKIPLYQKVCCNFEKLERKSKKYDPNYVPSKKKIRATVPSK